jgi:HD superfamily phosphodiesterase
MTEAQLLMIQNAQTFVTDLLQNKLSENIRFHTLEHTQEVVAACERMADFFHIPDDEKQALLIAAWFHDTGYTGGYAKDHET